METQKKKTRFIGWIPCVSGRLFFGYVACGIGEPVYCELETIDGPENGGVDCIRNIVVSSRVDWKDTHSRPESGSFEILMTATKSGLLSDSCLDGDVYLFPGGAENTYFHEKICPNLRAAANALRQGDDAAEHLALVNRSLLEETDRAEGKYPVFRVPFSVRSNGFAHLSSAEALDPTIEANEGTRFVATRQAYYYLKYSLHRHAHHPEELDSITTIHAASLDGEILADRIINELKRELVRHKRESIDDPVSSSFDAIGFTTYAKSLVLSCYREGLIAKDVYRAELEYLQNLADSLDAKAKKDLAKQQRASTASANARAFVLAILALLTPLVLVFRTELAGAVGQDGLPVIRGFVLGLFTNGTKLFLFLVFLGVLYWCYRQYEYLGYTSKGLVILIAEKLVPILSSLRRAKIVTMLLIVMSSCVFLLCFVWFFSV